MKFSTLTVLALISGASAFVPSTIQNRFAVKNTPSIIQQIQTAPTALHMADGPSDIPQKKSRKEQLIEEIEAKTQAASVRRLALEAELAASEAERINLLKEAERISKLSEPRTIDFGAAGQMGPLLAGGLAAAVGARQALGNRSEMQDEFKRKQQIARAAAEQDAKNRAASEARIQATKSAVSIFFFLMYTFFHLTGYSFLIMINSVSCFLRHLWSEEWRQLEQQPMLRTVL
jgi:hypothetical protein